ncbi:acyltransferase family protein [Oryzifoliimicrobium ureilyticus]|uniref:acyltransferase family protein n=1 Tax=Oryzifoliimicrobium ureilyticus TaxID=3113724 RepID=UPI0030762E54
MLSDKREVGTIQYLRAIAALAVVGFHISETYGLGLQAGAAGVDIFFVISGFIMWVTTNDRRMTPGDFLWRRIRRIVPLYWIVTVTTFALASWKPQFFFGAVVTLVNLAGSLVFLPVIHDDALKPIVMQGWTLSYEMFFYLVFSITLVFQGKKRLICLLGLLFAIVAFHPFAGEGYAAIFSEPIILEFAAGLAIGALWTSGWRMPFFIALAAAIVGLLMFPLMDLAAPHLDRALRWGVPAGLLLLGVVFMERERTAPHLPLLHYLGDASYSIYIWHVLAGIVVTAILLRASAPLVLQAPVIFVGSVLLSLAGYHFVERPLLRVFQSARKPALG